MSQTSSHSDAFSPRDWLLLAAVAASWGPSFLLIEVGLDHLEPALVTLLRLLFGAATLAFIPAARRKVPRFEFPRVALLGLLWMALPLLLFPFAQQWIDSSLAGMLNGAVPLFTAAIATFIRRRLPGILQGIGLLGGFLGVIAISWPAVQGARASALGAGMILLATVMYGIAINVAVPLQERYGSLPVIWRAQLFAILLVAPPGLWGIRSSSLALSSMLAIAVLGCLGTALAFVAFTTLVGRVGAARGSIAIYFLPVIAITLGVLLRDENVARSALVGTLLVIAGAYLTSRREGRHKRSVHARLEAR